MRQLIHAARCLSVALALVAAFAIIPVDRDAAANDEAKRNAVEEVCLEEGGIYWENYIDGVMVAYGCDFLDGDELHCIPAGICTWTTTNVSEPSKAPDPTYGEPYPPAQSAPADSSQSGYEYQTAGR